MSSERADIEALAPCPFCGGTDLQVKIGTILGRNPVSAVYCMTCGGAGAHAEVEQHAKEAWNRRAILKAAASREELREELIALLDKIEQERCGPGQSRDEYYSQADRILALLPHMVWEIKDLGESAGDAGLRATTMAFLNAHPDASGLSLAVALFPGEITQEDVRWAQAALASPAPVEPSALASLVEPVRYVCKQCGLEINDPERRKYHRVIKGDGQEAWCGPLEPAPAAPVAKDEHVGRRYRCIVPTYPSSRKGIGTCVDFTWAGARNGWFTLRWADGSKGLLAGEEIVEVRAEVKP